MSEDKLRQLLKLMGCGEFSVENIILQYENQVSEEDLGNLLRKELSGEEGNFWKAIKYLDLDVALSAIEKTPCEAVLTDAWRQKTIINYKPKFPGLYNEW